MRQQAQQQQQQSSSEAQVKLAAAQAVRDKLQAQLDHTQQSTAALHKQLADAHAKVCPRRAWQAQYTDLREILSHCADDEPGVVLCCEAIIGMVVTWVVCLLEAAALDEVLGTSGLQSVSLYLLGCAQLLLAQSSVAWQCLASVKRK